MTSPASSSAVAAPPASAKGDLNLWIEVLRSMEKQLQRSQFITWFRDTAVLGREEGKLIVGLPLPMSLNWHMEHYRMQTLKEIQKIDSSIEQIVYKVDVGLKDNPERTVDLLELFPEQKKRKLPGKQEVKMAEGLISKILSPRYTLENFVVESELLKGRQTTMYIETFCLEMQAFPEQLERYEKEKDKGIRLNGKELGV